MARSVKTDAPKGAKRPPKSDSPVEQALDAADRHVRAGHIGKAKAMYQEVLQRQSHNAKALHSLGVIASQEGHLERGLDLISKAIDANRKIPFFHANLGEIYRRLGRFDDAIAACRGALDLYPVNPGALNTMGAALHARGDVNEAESTLRKALEFKPDFAIAHVNFGNVLQAQGNHEEALAAYREALRLQPGFAGAHAALGHALQRRGRTEEAVACYRRALEIAPNEAAIWSNLGTALRTLGKTDEAESSFREAIRVAPGIAAGHANLGMVLLAQDRQDEAVDAYRRALALEPDDPQAHYNLGNALYLRGELDAAVAAYRQALELEPDHVEAHKSLANAFQKQRKIDEAVAAFRRALDLKPDSPIIHSSLLFCLNFQPAYDPAALFGEHQRWAQQHALGLGATARPHRNPRDPDRRLRIGYVSPDFHTHSVSYFFEALLRAHGPAQVEAICYADVAWPDETTTRLQGLADKWRDIRGMSDDQVADRVRDDGIDILVDLAGHTGDNRLLVFARKPAPVQVTYIGYCNTTGLATIDYRLTDALVDPEGQDAFYSEKLFRLPRCFLCYTPPAEAPAIGPLSARERGHLTFGSFNDLAKLNPDVAALWSRVLAAFPSSRLLLQAEPFRDPATRERYTELFAQCGLSRDRIDCVEHSASNIDHMALYGNVDIGLDPFPYNGATTTCEALWMGVPVITLAGRAHVGRVGLSLLTAVGLRELIAETPNDYVAIAKRLAGDLDRLAALRSGLRSRMSACALCDQAGLGLAVESAYRTIWRRWCEQDQAASPS